MAIRHKFMIHDFNNGFQTHDAILDVTPYKPEVLIVGTYNPETVPNANSDFFYSRNYLWPAFANLFIYGAPALLQRRDDAGNIPALADVFALCTKLKLSFADLILEVMHQDNPEYVLIGNRVHYQDGIYDLINDGGLAALNGINQVHWASEHIITFIEQNPSIKYIYFTRQPIGIWADPWDQIVDHPSTVNCERKINIYTPSGRGLRGVPRMSALLRHWLCNVDPDFGTLCPLWLASHGVDVNAF